MDPVGNMLVQLRNAGTVGGETVLVPYSKLKHAIANVLLKKGYVASVARRGKKDGRILEIGVKYEGGKSRIRGTARVSRVSRRMYMGVRDIKPVRQGYGDVILSTPKGILTGKDARKDKVGGEVLFKIW